MTAYCPICNRPLYKTNNGEKCIPCSLAAWRAWYNGGKPTPAQKREQQRKKYNEYQRNYQGQKRREKLRRKGAG